MKYFNPAKRSIIFEKIQLTTPDSNTFDLSHANKLSFNMGELVPILVQECIPGDKFNIKTEHMIKVAPLVFPVMHKVKTQTHYFYVPNRILWEEWEKYQSFSEDGLEQPIHPYINLHSNTGVGANQDVIDICSIADYMGIPTGNYSGATIAGDVNHPINKINALPFAAMFKCFDDYFRDQNLVPEKWKPLSSGDNSFNLMFYDLTAPAPANNSSKIFKKGSLLMRAWEKDYFTSALPFAQKGQPVTIPLGDTAKIEYSPDPDGDGSIIRDAETGLPVTGNHSLTEGDGFLLTDDLPNPGSSLRSDLDNSKTLIVNLRTALAATINSLRIAEKLQEFFERNAMIGTRYIEQLWGRFGVRSSNKALQRSEYIGGTSAPLVFGEILQTSQTDGTPLGQQAGHGGSINADSSVNYYCEEHGWIIGFVSILPETNYSQGLHKKFLKDDILDYYDPIFANLGEQDVQNYELYANTPINNAMDTFGYQSRYSELKYNCSEIHGEFRDELSAWHMARKFASLPSLNAVFVTSNPTHDIFADTSPETQKMYAYFWHTIIAKRKIPFYSSPSLSSAR